MAQNLTTFSAVGLGDGEPDVDCFVMTVDPDLLIVRFVHEILVMYDVGIITSMSCLKQVLCSVACDVGSAILATADVFIPIVIFRIMMYGLIMALHVMGCWALLGPGAGRDGVGMHGRIAGLC